MFMSEVSIYKNIVLYSDDTLYNNIMLVNSVMSKSWIESTKNIYIKNNNIN